VLLAPEPCSEVLSKVLSRGASVSLAICEVCLPVVRLPWWFGCWDLILIDLYAKKSIWKSPYKKSSIMIYGMTSSSGLSGPPSIKETNRRRWSILSSRSLLLQSALLLAVLFVWLFLIHAFACSRARLFSLPTSSSFAWGRVRFELDMNRQGQKE
jgi:hypothetical protein